MVLPWLEVGLPLLAAPHVFVLLALLPIVMVALRQRLSLDKEGQGLLAQECSSPRKAETADAPAAADKGLNTNSAAACWARGDGRMKHRILRPEGSPPEPPIPLTADGEALMLPPLAEGEEAGLQVLEASLADLRADGRRMDRETLLRFLRARKGNVRSAATYYRQAEAYRDEINVRQMDTLWNLEAYERCFAPWWVRGGIVGLDLKGNVVGWERFGRSCLPQMLREVPWEHLKRLDAVHTQRTLAAFEEYSLHASRPLGNAVMVMDFEGFTWDYCTPFVVRSYAKIVAHRDMLIPNTLAHIFLIRVPKPFALAWSAYRPLMDPTTREKVQIVAGDERSLELLRKYLPDSTIPAYLGGSLKYGCDPDCRALLGSSENRLPPEALARLRAEIAGKSPGAGAGPGGADGDREARDSKADARSCCLGCLAR